MDEIKVTEMVLLLFLFLAAFEDLRSQRLSLILLASGGAGGVLVRILTGTAAVKDMAEGLGLGMVMLLISYAGRQALGYGDGLLMAACGVFLGGIGNVILLLCSLMIAGVYSIILLAAKKKKGKDRLPFAPFVLGGFVLMKGLFG